MAVNQRRASPPGWAGEADGSRVEPCHVKRPRFTKSRPLHITLEMSEDVPNLRAANLGPVVTDAIGRANVREDFRVVHSCLAGTHIHLICEAEGPAGLASGMKSLNGTIAKAINKRLGRTGRVIANRIHLHVLRTKTECGTRCRTCYGTRNATGCTMLGLRGVARIRWGCLGPIL